MIHKMTLVEWSKLINQIEEIEEDVLDENQTQKDPTHVYMMQASANFAFNNSFQTPGLYYLRASKQLAESLNNNVYKVRKLSFVEIVYIYDSNFNLFQQTAKRLLSFEENASTEINNFVNLYSTKALEKMRDKVKVKYFDQGMRGVVLSFFSAISNFFMKYIKAAGVCDTGIYWPGNSSSYADKVIKKIQEVKNIILDVAIEVSRDQISKHLEIDSKELARMSFSDINSLRKRKIRLLHFDKNLTFDSAADSAAHTQYCKINAAFKHFQALIELREKISGKNERGQQSSDPICVTGQID
jgi:hypothetical protein